MCVAIASTGRQQRDTHKQRKTKKGDREKERGRRQNQQLAIEPESGPKKEYKHRAYT